MAAAFLEHANVTVRDVPATAQMLCDLFDWKVRWKGEEGASIHGGTSWHVGGPDSYLAIYQLEERTEAEDTYHTTGGLNHLGVVVDDLDAVEARVLGMGFETHSHADYEPGRRFYFDDFNGIEIEVVSYT